MRKVLKITLYIICSIIFILLCAVVYLNTPGGQNFVRGKVEAYLNHKLKTEVRIGHLGYGLPKFIVLDDVLFLDQAKDTLLAAGELKVDIDMLKLLHKSVDVQQLVFKGVHAHIYRNMPDTTYNFSYIVTAFTGNTPKKPQKAKDTSAPLNITLDRVKFDDIHVRLDDQTRGMHLAINLDHLDLKMEKLDLDKMLFHVKDLSVAGLETTFSQDTSYLPKSTDTSKTNLQLIADNVGLERFALRYSNSLNKIFFGLNLGELQLQLKKFGLADNVVDMKKLAMKNSSIVVNMGKLATPPAFVDTVVKKDTTAGWHVTADDMNLAGVSFKMDNENSPRQQYGMDYSHLYFQNTSLVMRGLLYTSDTIAGDIKHFAGKEQCGFDVKELRTVFNYNPQGATLGKFYLQTPNTILQDHIEIHYPSLTAMQKHLQSMRININLKNSILGLPDVLVFVPQLRTQEIFKKYKNGHFKLEATMNGPLNNLNIPHFYAAGMDNTEILLNGRLSGLPEPKDLSYNLHITKFQSSRKDVSELVPDSLLSSIRLPDKFGITGQIAGTELDYKTDLYFASTDGLAYIKGLLAMSPGKNKEQYDLAIKTDQLNVGRILNKDSLMGMISLDLNIKGRSFDFKTMFANVDGGISSAVLKGYRYHNITLNGKVAAQQGDISLTSVDTNLQLHLKGHGDFTGKYAAIKADINIDSIDFQALKLYSSEFRARGLIHLDFPELNPDYPRGTFAWQQPIINANNVRYYLDNMYIVSRPSEDTGQNIIADLGVMQATITGKTPLSKIAGIIQDHINRHYVFPKDSTKKSLAQIAVDTSGMAVKKKTKDTAKVPGDYDLKLTAHVIDKPMLHSLLPGLTSFDSIRIDGSLSPRFLSLDVSIPNLEYSSTTIQNGAIKVRGTDSAFTYNVTVDQISQKSFALYYADIHGNLDQNTITTSVSLSDENRKERFALAANMVKAGDTQIVSLQPGLKLNYNTWDVAEPNRIVLANGGFYIQNFSISNGGQYIKANSAEAKINTPLKVDVTNFLLSNFTDVVSAHDTLLANGILGGTISLDRITPSPQMTSDLQIQNLSVLGDTLGNLQLQVNNKQDNVLDTKMKLNGQGNDISLTGSYFTQPSSGNDFSFDLDVNALAVHSFETIAMRQIRNSSGFLRGDLKIQGTPSAPQITGELKTDNLVTTISQLNATFKMPSEKIEFTNNNITFNNFTLHDSADNKAVLTGSINTTELLNPELDLKVKADNWRAIHSTAKDNKDFYGDLLLTTNLTIKGTPSAPNIDGSLKFLKGTNFTVVTPESNPVIESSEGIVKFVNMKDTGRLNVLVPRKKDSIRKRKLAAGSEINVNVTTDKNAQFTLIIDQASGDFLSVKGDASLNAAVTPGGAITLSGSYELHGGAYQLNYNFIKRKFLIKDGSTITFGGDPIKGTTLDVTAVYEAQIPPYDLVERQVPDQSQLNYYKQRLPFDIDLYMKGEVLTPSLTFDVILPDNKVYPLSADQIELIQGKLNQVRTDTADLNKQVFAVLILGRFVSDDPFSSGASSSLTNTALQSVSTFIGEQLNQAAGKLVKGVDVSADLATTDDYTSGSMQERTDLNLAASKTLLNDRLKLTIGNDFELEGPQTTNNQSSTLVPSNLAADYLLSSDGRYTVRAYRKNYDEGVLEGYVTETGLNFIVSLDYNRFKNIFKKKKKEQSTGAGK